MKRRDVLWFCAGICLTGILSIGHEAARYVPAAIAFGLLCFGCGIVLMQFVSLRKQEEQSLKEMMKWVEESIVKGGELAKEQNACEYEKLKWQEQRNALDCEKEAWEVEKDIAIREEALRLLEKEAARRGGEQIERDMNST